MEAPRRDDQMTTYPNLVTIIGTQFLAGILHYGGSYVTWYRHNYFIIIGALMLTMVPWPIYFLLHSLLSLIAFRPSVRILRYWLIVGENYGILYLQYYYLGDTSYYYLMYPYIAMIYYVIPQGLFFRHDPLPLVTSRLIYSYGYMGSFFLLGSLPGGSYIAHWPLALETVRVIITRTPPPVNHKQYQFPLELGEGCYLLIGTIRYYYRKWR